MRKFYVSWAIGDTFGYDIVELPEEVRASREAFREHFMKNSSHFNYYVDPLNEPAILGWSLIGE